MVCSKVPFYVVVEGEAEEINFLMLKLCQQPLVFFNIKTDFFLFPTETDEKYRQIFKLFVVRKWKFVNTGNMDTQNTKLTVIK